MNDSRETSWAIPVIREQIKRRRTDSNKNFFDGVAKVYDDNRPVIYLASFSSERDVLSQWRAYSSDGEGYAIAFSPDSFSGPLQIPQPSAAPSHRLGLFKISYLSESEIAKAVGEIFDKFQGCNDNDVGLASIECMTLLRNLGLSIKNPAFLEEAEWRIGYSAMTLKNFATEELEVWGELKIGFRETKHGIAPYFSLPFTQKSKRKAITEIVLGPKNRTDSEFIDMLLLSNGYGSVPITRSAASYR